MIDTVVVVSEGSPDYLIDTVANGTVRFLGRGNVHIEYFWFGSQLAEGRRFRHFYNVRGSCL